METQASQGLLPALTSKHSSEPFKRGRFAVDYIIFAAMGLDYLSILFGIAVALVVYRLVRNIHVTKEAFKLVIFSLQYTALFILFGKLHSLYGHEHSLLRIRETAGILRVSVYSLALLSLGVFFSGMFMPRLLLLLTWIFMTIFLLLQKQITRRLIASWKGKNATPRNVLIAGVGPEARRLFSFLHNSPDLQMRPVGFVEECDRSDDSRVIYAHGYHFKDHAPVYGRVDRELLDRLGIADIFIADPQLASSRVGDISFMAQEKNIELSFVGAVQPHFASASTNLRVFDGLFVSSSSVLSSSSLVYDWTKRALDIAVAFCCLLAGLPMFVGIAVWIKLTSEGPVFFKQERIGRDGVPFKMLKFRSMYTTAPKYGRSPEDPHDPRITTAGRYLRRTSLDELPQLINVFLGDMSLVGPRPEMPFVVEKYTSRQANRLAVPQGLTGIWQLSADRKFAIHESIEYDLYYIENRGLFMDLAILLHTLAFAMKGI